MKSQKLIELAAKLFEETLKSGDLFDTKIILVPSNKTREYLKTFYLQNYDTVLLNYKILSINSNLLELFEVDHKYSIATKDDILCLIVKYLSSNEIDQLKEYFNCDDIIKGIKIYDVANELTKLFNQYDDDLFILNGYQKDIYNYVIKELEKRNLITKRLLLENYSIKKNLNISIFGFLRLSNFEEKLICKIKENNTLKEYYLKESDQIGIKTIIRAPNKLREIEILHSHICDLLKYNNKYSDFLVISSDVNQYKNEISRVFTQDNLEYLNIPYYIESQYEVDNDVYRFLNTIIKIFNNGFYSREDVINILNNNTILKNRKIDQEKSKSFADLIYNTNSHRETDRIKDFNNLINRLLLSFIYDNNQLSSPIEIDDKPYLPYQSISIDKISAYQFIEILKDLESLIDLMNKNKIVSKEFIISFKENLDKWLSIKDENDIETSFYYKNVSNFLDLWVDYEISNVHINVLLYFLSDYSKNKLSNKGQIYSNGVSFINFNPNVIVGVKHTFFIGCDANSFPKEVKKSAFDLREETNDYHKDLDSFNSYLNNSDTIYISYVYQDLKKDSDKYLSNFIKNVKEIKQITVDLDENRNYDSLYTKKEFFNKEFIESLKNGKKIKRKIDVEIEPMKLTSISLNFLANYLNEPMSALIDFCFGKDYSKDPTDNYEKFELDNINKASAFKEVINDKCDYDNAKKTLIAKGILPNFSKYFSDKSFDELIFNTNRLFDFIENEKSINYGTNGKIIKPESYTTSSNIEIVKIDSFYRFEANNNTYYYYYLSLKDAKKENISTNYLCRLYLCSLVDIAKQKTNKVYNMKLYNGKNEYIEYKVNSTLANQTIDKIVNSFMNYENFKFMPFEIINEDSFDQVNSFDDLLKSLNNSWKFFSSKKLIDISDGLGFDKNFIKDFKESYEKKQNLILFMVQKENDE